VADVEFERLPDLLVLGQERWDDVARRNQLIVRALSQRNPRTRILFAELPLRPRELSAWRPPRARRRTSNIWTVQVVRPVPDSVSRRLSDIAEATQIRRAARSIGLTRPLIWTQDPRAEDLIDLLPVEGLIYDLTDDWAAFETDPAQRLRVRCRIHRLGRRAKLLLACSRWLESDARTWGGQPVYLPNAADPPEPSGPVPEEIAALPRPRVGYAGTLHSARLDVALLQRAAALRPHWSFAFLGPDLLEPDDRERLFALANVHYLGVKPHGDVRSHLAGFDVALLPNRVTDFTRSLDPLKIYEYLAAGLPIVATPAGIPADLSAYVRVAGDADEMVTEIERAIDEDGAGDGEARRAAVAEETWSKRAASIERELRVVGFRPRSADVSVVIVSFNTRELLVRCLDAVSAQAGLAMQIIVVDNGSTDGSRELVRERFPEVELIELSQNVGFARANNLAFQRCRGEYVLLLNSDAFVHPGALRELVAAAKRHPRAAAVGPRLLNPDGTLQRSAWPFPHPLRLLLEAFGLHRILRNTPFYDDLGIWAHDEERSVDFLVGACLLVRAAALREVAGFDERFWMYAEEADLQQRLRARGWGVIFTPNAAVTHIGSGSAKDSSLRLSHFYTGQMNFLRKHRGPIAWPVARLALLIGSILRHRWRSAWVAVSLRRRP
jgi:GT2 family glycosyltransferase/glycosyltransferase involved in cell wall biosynthesis